MRLTAVALALLGAAGQFLGYANPFVQLPPLVLLTPACLIIIARLMPEGPAGAKGCFYAAWLCGTLGQGASVYWLAVPMHDFAGIPWIFGMACVLLLGAYLGLYTAFFALGMRLLYRRFPALAASLLAGPLWAGLELARGLLFTGFPWVSLSTAFAAWPLWAQGASAVGSYGLSGLYTLIAACLTQAAPLRFIRGHEPLPSRARRFIPFAVALAVLLGLYQYGLHSLREPLPAGTPVITAGLAQGNVNQMTKWEPAYQQHTLARYMALSEKALDPKLGAVTRPVDLLLWPETAMPFYVEDNPQLAAQLTAFATRWQVPLAFGAPGKGVAPERGTTWHNRLWLFTPGADSLQQYDKSHLVPFGEYVPFSLRVPFIEYLVQGMDFTPGSGSVLHVPFKIPAREAVPEAANTFRAPDLALTPVAVGVLICYEAIFPELAQKRVEDGAVLFLNVSNDGWFGRSAAPEQHLQLTAMRAIEQNRFILRATNTGYSAVIDNKGRILTRGSLFKPECIIAEAALLEEKTLYHSWHMGLWYGFILLPLAALACCFLPRLRRV